MKCPSCGFSDDPLKDSRTGQEVKPGDVYDVLANGEIRLHSVTAELDAAAAADAQPVA